MRQRFLALCVLLTAINLIVFSQLRHADFVTLDDPEYITENPHLQNGMTQESVAWALTSAHSANWHPLTWMSHMLDVQLFGLNAHRHHLTSLLLHVLNTLLLFGVLCRMTGALWRSAAVAALFAIHPLHVESVAWLAERKDVLSTFFWILTMGAYVFYVERPTLKRYAAVFVALLLGLMSKPMLVTLPCVLLLLDYWPLRRFELSTSSVDSRRGQSSDPNFSSKSKKKSRRSAASNARLEGRRGDRNSRRPSWRSLLLEKLPLFALTVLSAIVTLIAQQGAGAIKTTAEFSVGDRVANALVSYARYLGKAIWPSALAVYYPHPGHVPLWQVAGAALLLCGITAVVIWKAKDEPYLFVGWLWFAGTLVPVIGIVQVGFQAMADRYTYVPLIGLFIMAVWGVLEILKRCLPSQPRARTAVAIALSAVVLPTLIFAAYRQTSYWRSSLALYDHALDVTTDNAVMFYDRGTIYLNLGSHSDQALADFNKAIQINPQHAQSYNNRGATYVALGNLQNALADFDKAVELDPRYSNFFKNRGAVYDKLGNVSQAIESMKAAATLGDKDAIAYLRSHGVKF